MKILSVQALRGPNFWSNSVARLIQVRLDLKPESEGDRDKFMFDLNQTIEKMGLPKIEETQTQFLMARFVGLIALKLQNDAGYNTSHLDVKATNEPGVVNLVFEYAKEKAGIKLAKACVEFANAIVSKKEISLPAPADVKDWIHHELPDEETFAWISAAKQKHLPVLNADEDWPLQLGWGEHATTIEKGQSLPNLEDFAQKQGGRIPLIAVTGSNGKTTTTRLIAHIVSQAGYLVGFTTSDGIYVNHKMVDQGDTTGPVSAEKVLRNRQVNFAVLETARGGIVRAGLGFDQCDVAVITNVQDDHLGISDINTMEDLARVKGVVLKSANPQGWVVVNADNAYCVGLGKSTQSNLACFSAKSNLETAWQTLPEAKAIAYISAGQIIFHQNGVETVICEVSEIPITFNGTLGFMIENALAATLACMVYGIPVDAIVKGLKTFYPSAEQTPGRMNLFEVGSHRVMVDFAHNPDGFTGIRDFMKGIKANKKIGIIVGTGDRKEEDVIMLGKLSAEMFDHVLIQQVKFLRGKTAEQLVKLLVQGIESVDKKVTWERVEDSAEPLGYALENAPSGSFIVALSDVLNAPFDLIEKYKSQHANA